MDTDKITEAIIGFANIHNTLEAEFFEKVHENTLALKLRKAELKVGQQKKIQVKYENIVVGDYVTDLIVNDSVLLEI